MEGALRILKRFIFSTMIISVFLLVLNFVLLGMWVFKGANNGQSPAAVVQKVAEGLYLSSDNYYLDSQQIELLNQNNAWAMLIDDTGHVAWNYMAPEELPEIYSLTDIAKLTRNYLLDYPVFVWQHDAGLVVIGYPQNSLAKYQYIFPTNWVSSFPLKITSLIIANIVLALLLSLFIGSKLIQSIRPLTHGIQALAEDKEVFIEPKGILAPLAQSINRVSSLLEERNENLKKRDEARSNWISGISHDIRTPLSMILGYSSGLEENINIPSEQRQQSSIIRQQAEYLSSLVSDLNLVSMLEYEMQPLNKNPIRISALIRQMATEFINKGLDELFTIDVKISNESIQVDGDRRLLMRAITNLVQNSINHNPDGCKIQLETALNPVNKTCSIIVSDNGKGIPQEKLTDLLELPYSSKRKHRVSNGHGLGLPMVARIAKAHQGHLLLLSDINKGVKVEIVLPTIKNDKKIL